MQSEGDTLCRGGRGGQRATPSAGEGSRRHPRQGRAASDTLGRGGQPATPSAGEGRREGSMERQGVCVAETPEGRREREGRLRHPSATRTLIPNPSPYPPPRKRSSSPPSLSSSRPPPPLPSLLPFLPPSHACISQATRTLIPIPCPYLQIPGAFRGSAWGSTCGVQKISRLHIPGAFRRGIPKGHSEGAFRAF